MSKFQIDHNEIAFAQVMISYARWHNWPPLKKGESHTEEEIREVLTYIKEVSDSAHYELIDEEFKRPDHLTVLKWDSDDIRNLLCQEVDSNLGIPKDNEDLKKRWKSLLCKIEGVTAIADSKWWKVVKEAKGISRQVAQFLATFKVYTEFGQKEKMLPEYMHMFKEYSPHFIKPTDKNEPNQLVIRNTPISSENLPSNKAIKRNNPFIVDIQELRKSLHIIKHSDGHLVKDEVAICRKR